MERTVLTGHLRLVLHEVWQRHELYTLRKDGFNSQALHKASEKRY